MKSADINVRHPCQIVSASGKLLSVLVQETNSQRTHGPHASIVGRTAADRNRNIPASAVKSSFNQFTRSVSRCNPWISFIDRHHRQSGCRRHLDDSRTVPRLAVTADHLFHQRTVYVYLVDRSVKHGYDSVDRTFPAVGHRNPHGLAVREHILRSRVQKRYNLFRRQCPFK